MRAVSQPKRGPTLAVLLALTTLAACERVTAPRPASETGAAALNVSKAGVGGSDMVPFHIRATFGVTADSKQIPCAGLPGAAIPAEYVGTGTGTHVGKASVTLTFVTCTLALPLGGVVAFTAEGRITVTAANGDVLYGIGTITQFANGDFVLNSGATTGGTGRFANATGTSSGSGWIDRVTLQGYFEFKGLISRPNA